MNPDFENLISTFQSTISDRDFYCDFEKIKKNSFSVKIKLNILNSLLWEKDIDSKFIELVRKYPDIKEVLPILLAVREKFQIVYNKSTKHEINVSSLFSNKILNSEEEQELLNFFNKSGLKSIFENRDISDLNDYVFWIETWLDSNARKNRWWTQMEDLVEFYVKKFCELKCYKFKSQATCKHIKSNWWIDIESDKSERRFDFAIFNWSKVFLIETNFYSAGWSKLKAVSWEFSMLYDFLAKQNIKLFRITDGKWWTTAKKPLEEAYNSMNGDIFNIRDLKNDILEKLIK